MTSFSKLASVLRHLPGQCQVCARWPALPICADCAKRFAQPKARCETCARPLHGTHARCGACLSERRPAAIDTCLASVDYAYPWDQLVARFKFRQEPALAQPLATLMLQVPQMAGLLRQCDWIIPIPVTPARLAERGYNQAWEMVKALRTLTDADCAPGWADALRRIGQAPDQHNLPAQQRINNLKGAFRVDPTLAHRLRDSHVLLIDDVSTTGATLRAAAEALRRAGASRISAAVFAHTASG